MLRRTLAALLACAAFAAFASAAAPKTVCTITINSSDEKEVLLRQLPRGDYRVVELVQRGRPGWLAEACHQGVVCDTLVISGHFDDGSEFYTDSFDKGEFLTMHELQRASCSASCGGIFAQLKDVYLFGCNTLKSTPRHVASAEVVRSLLRGGRTRAEAEDTAARLSERYGQSNRDRLRHVFPQVPVLYGFASKAPLGRSAGPLLERYFQSAPAGEVSSGRSSATLLALFGPSSMVAEAGLADTDPHAGFRRDMCGFADEAPSHAQKLALLHAVLQRDVTEVRMFLDHLERYTATLGLAERATPEVAAGLAAIAEDRGARDRFMAFARDADAATVQARMFTLAQGLGWLTPAQEQAEFLQMLAERMAQDRLGQHEVDLVCESPLARGGDAATPLLARARPGHAAHAAVLACLGHAESHERVLRTLTSARDDDVAVAQVYLRHRPLSGVAELRSITAGIARMPAGDAQVRALQTLARLHPADAQSLQAIAQLFPQARSLEMQRAIAGILVRADTRGLQRAELARTLRQHRLKSPDGSDVIDLLIRLLQAA